MNSGHLPAHTHGKKVCLQEAGYENVEDICVSEVGEDINKIKDILKNSPESLFIIGGAMPQGFPDLVKELNIYCAEEVPSIIVHQTSKADFPPDVEMPPSVEVVNQSAVTIANRYLE